MALRRHILGFLIGSLCLAGPVAVAAQGTIVEDTVVVSKAKVIEVVSQREESLPGIGTPVTIQELRVRITDGEEKGAELALTNDYLPLRKGQSLYVSHVTNHLDGTDRYMVYDVNRLPAIFALLGVFIIAVVALGGIQGIRGLLSLAGSLLLILYVLLPGILHGYSPVLVSVGVASLIVIVGSYVTHGFSRMTTAAVIGMLLTLAITSLLAYLSVSFAKLTGLDNEEALYLNYNTQGGINFVGLLFGGIMIGLLGALYDAAIGQAVAVDELRRVGPHLSKKYIFQRALRIGREHIGALVDTLAIAYVGASLPLLLLFYGTGQGRELSQTENCSRRRLYERS